MCRSRASRPAARAAGDPWWCGGPGRHPRAPRRPPGWSPARALTSVDLPTPDEPRKTAVVPGDRSPQDSSRPRASGTLTVTIGTPPRRSEPARDPRRVRDEVGLAEAPPRAVRRSTRPSEVALQPAEVEVAVERRHEERDVDVGSQDLVADAGVRVAPRERPIGAEGRRLDRGPEQRHPVADDRQVGPAAASYRSRPGSPAVDSPARWRRDRRRGAP